MAIQPSDLLIEIEKLRGNDPLVEPCLKLWRAGIISPEKAYEEITARLATKSGEPQITPIQAPVPNQPTVSAPHAEKPLFKEYPHADKISSQPDTHTNTGNFGEAIKRDREIGILAEKLAEEKFRAGLPVKKQTKLQKLLKYVDFFMAGFGALGMALSYFIYQLTFGSSGLICLPEKTFTAKYKRAEENLLQDDDEGLPDPRQMNETGKGAPSRSDGAPWPSEVRQDLDKASTPPEEKEEAPAPKKAAPKAKPKASTKFEVSDIPVAKTLPKIPKSAKKKLEEDVPDVVIPADEPSEASAAHVQLDSDESPKKAEKKKKEKDAPKSESSGEEEGWPE